MALTSLSAATVVSAAFCAFDLRRRGCALRSRPTSFGANGSAGMTCAIVSASASICRRLASIVGVSVARSALAAADNLDGVELRERRLPVEVEALQTREPRRPRTAPDRLAVRRRRARRGRRRRRRRGRRRRPRHRRAGLAGVVAGERVAIGVVARDDEPHLAGRRGEQRLQIGGDDRRRLPRHDAIGPEPDPAPASGRARSPLRRSISTPSHSGSFSARKTTRFPAAAWRRVATRPALRVFVSPPFEHS